MEGRGLPVAAGDAHDRGRMRYRVLGPLEVHGSDGVAVALRSARARRLLAALLVDAGAVVSVDRLGEIVWGDGQPRHLDAALHSLVSRVRGVLRAAGGDADIATRPPGYLLDVDRGKIDAARFEDLVGHARARMGTDPAAAAATLDEALLLWRGRPYDEVADEPFAQPESARLQELALSALEDRAEAALDAGDGDAAVARLEALVASEPLRERPRRLLMTALHRAGRTADALGVYRHYRELLDEELGLEPSPALAGLERDILRHDPALVEPVSKRPPGTRTAPTGNLLRPATALVGRDADRAGLVAALRAGPAVTVVGAGGVGKTSLAVQVADDVRAAFPDGVWLVELAALDRSAAVVDAVAAVLGVRPHHGVSTIQRLLEFLQSRRALLVLDNCEHVALSAGQAVETLTAGCPQLRLLATSREPLGAATEQVYPLAPLAVPPAGGDAVAVADAPAAMLLQARVRALAPSFALTDENADAVAEICRRLDGMPLALELAATRLATMHPDDVARRLDTRFRLLRSGRQRAAARHRTLRAVVDWSYDLLEDDQRAVFDRLSVFAGSFTLAAAEAVTAGDEVAAADVAGIVADLAAKSMVVAVPASGRYALLDTLRAYGRDRLAARGGVDGTRARHARHHLEAALEADAGLRGPEERRWITELDRDLDELRAAHAWALRHALDVALALSGALVRYADVRVVSEIYDWAERAAAAAADHPQHATHRSLPLVLACASFGARNRGDLDRAVALARAGCDLAGPGDPRRPYALVTLADVALFGGELTQAAALAKEAAETALAGGDPCWAVSALAEEALARAYGGDTAGALKVAERAASVAAATANPTAIGWAKYAVAEALLDRDPDDAVAHAQAALETARAAGDRYLAGVALVSVATLQARHGDPFAGLQRLAEVVDHWEAVGNRALQWTTLRSVISVLTRLGENEAAAVLRAALAASTTAAPAYGPDADRLAETDALLRTRLPAGVLADAQARGRALGDAAAVAFARAAIIRALSARPAPAGA